jgi:chromosome segregation ATPase
MSDREFKSASEAVEFYKAECDRLREDRDGWKRIADMATAERDRLLTHNEELGTTLLRLREENVRLLHHVGKRAEAEAERDRLTAKCDALDAQVAERADERDRLQSRVNILEASERSDVADLVAERDRLRSLVDEVVAGYEAPPGEDFDWSGWYVRATEGTSDE